MKLLRAYANSSNCSREFKKRTNLSIKNKKKKTSHIAIIELIEKYLNGEILKDEVLELSTYYIISEIDDELLIDFFIKYYNVKRISLYEINRSIDIINKSINILENNLGLLKEYEVDVIENESQIRNIYSDVDKNLSENTKKYIKKFYFSKVKSIQSAIKLYKNILEALNSLLDMIKTKKYKKINFENNISNIYIPFEEFLNQRIKNYLKVHSRINKLIVSDERIEKLHRLFDEKILSYKIDNSVYQKEYINLKNINDKRNNRVNEEENENLQKSLLYNNDLK